jgi:hypothetical protein
MQVNPCPSAKIALNILPKKPASAVIRLAVMPGVALVIAAVTIVALWGCGNTHEQPAAKISTATSALAAPAELHLTVVDDPELAKSIARLRGEWKAQTGSELSVQGLSADEAATAQKLDADAVIYSPALLGMLAERKLIRPLSQAWLAGDPLEAADLLPPLDSLQFTWDGQPYAVPLGSPVLVLLYRPDLFEQFGKQPPRTWQEYQQLADFFSDPKKFKSQERGRNTDADDRRISEPWSGTVEPLAPGWAGRMLLARAAAYAKHRDYFSVLFDRETMEPLIAGPPFVRALTELVAATKTEPKNADSLTPPDAARWWRCRVQLF